MNKKAAFLTLGCKVNSYETEAIRGMFQIAGYEVVDFKELADIYVVNTCTVTNMADRKSRQMLHQAKKRNPNAIIVAVGCYVQAAEESLLRDNSVDLVVGNNRKSEIINLIETYNLNNIKKNKDNNKDYDNEINENEDLSSDIDNYMVVDIGAEKDYEELSLASTMEKTRAFIKIQDGCNRFCSYCIIPYVRGRVRSRNENEIIEEITKLAEAGYKEFVLTGIHISSYGTDKQGVNNMPLASLIKDISRIPGIERIRLGSLEPGIITEEFVQEIIQVKQFCPHFHLSLQSGSNTVLQRMNRKYSAEEYEEKVKLLRKYFDKPAFTTDIIVGFPGESQEEFEETLDYVKKIGFSDIHVFKYSKRAGTKAAKMGDQIQEEIKHSRSNELIAIAKQMSEDYKVLFLGTIENMLVEEEIMVEGTRYQIGHNERYLKLAILALEDLTNQIINVKVETSLTEEILLATKSL